MSRGLSKLEAKRRLVASLTRMDEELPAFSSKGKLGAKQRFANSDEGKALVQGDILRIVGLPVVMNMTEEEYEAYCQQVMLAKAFQDGRRLFTTQADSGLQFQEYRGLFAPVGVGWGKTLITLMCANIAYTQFGIRKMMLLVPSNVMPQLTGTDLKWARQMVPINYPVHVLYDKNTNMRRRIASSGQPGLYIVPYSLLSRPDSVDNINDIQPGFIACDEVHYLKDRRSARTKRIMDYVETKRPIGLGLSGTITRKSIMDYHHIIRWCLGMNCPLPYSTQMAGDWASVLDSDAMLTGGGATGPLEPLISWARTVDTRNRYEDDVAGFRRAYKLRLTTCPGVVASGDADIGVSLIIANKPVKNYEAVAGWDTLNELMETVEEEWLTPNGDEIEYAIHKFKWLYELSAGFYNELKWPKPDEYAERKGISVADAMDVLERAKDWHEAHQIYAKRLRMFLQFESKPKLDTPMLVGANMMHYGAKNVPNELYQLWSEMKACDFEGRPERDKTAIRVCSFKVDAAVAWAKSLPKGKGAIIWVYHQEIGRWTAEKGKQAGLDILHCPAGSESNKSIIDKANKGKIVVASLTSHGTGKNLQHFQNQYVLQWPRPAALAEQFLGRCHRNGQEADELVVHTNNTLLVDDLNFASCLNDALYIHQTTDARQKMIVATYTPLPKIFPPSVLIERGLKAKPLDREQVRMLEDKFGSMQHVA